MAAPRCLVAVFMRKALSGPLNAKLLRSRSTHSFFLSTKSLNKCTCSGIMSKRRADVQRFTLSLAGVSLAYSVSAASLSDESGRESETNNIGSGRSVSNASLSPVNSTSTNIPHIGTTQISHAENQTSGSESKAFEPDDPRLKSSECLKNASGLSVDSTSAVLSQSVYAVIKVEQEYVQLIDVLIKLMEYHLQVLGHDKEEQRIADIILETRHELNAVNERKQDLALLFACAEKLGDATAEVAFAVGCEYASTSMGERLYSAQQAVTRAGAQSRAAELRLQRAEAHVIEQAMKNTETQNTSAAGDDVTEDVNHGEKNV